MLKAALHCHSTYSDGEFTLRELREMFLKNDYQLVCMTDHAEWFEPEQLRAYVEECESLSDDEFRFLPGLEFECERKMHILGYGVPALAGSTEPEEVIKHIENQGGVSVIAHPGDSMFEWIETFETLPSGIEVWNSKYDGPLAPRPRTFRLLHRLQQRKPEMKAFYGQDLHWRNQHRGLSNTLRCESSNQTAVLQALRAGDYNGVSEGTELPATGELPEALLGDYGRINDRYMRKQQVFKQVKKMSGGFGKKLPAPIKRRLRKIFS